MTTTAASARPVQPFVGYGFAMSAAVLFASKGVLIKLAYAESLDAITLLALRMIFSVPIFVAVGLWTAFRAGARLPNAGDLWKSAAVGALGYWIASYADFVGLETLSPQFERLILFTYPAFVVLFGAMFFGQPVRPRSLAAFGVSYLGLAAIFLTDFSTEGSAIAVGTAWVLASAIAFALYQLFAKPMIGRLGAPLFTSVAMTGAAVMVLLQFAATRPVADLAVSPRGLALGMAVAILATVLPSYLMSFSLSRISAQANATIGTLSPVVTLVLAILILGETVTVMELVGTAMVIGGVALFTFVDRRS